MILYTKSPEDYTNGDVLTLASATLGIVGFAISGGPFAAAASAGGAIIGVASFFFSKNEILYYRLPDGGYLKLKPLTI